MNKIITLGDIFRNIETEEKAFKFLDYIKKLQKQEEEIERLNNIIKEVREYIKKTKFKYCDDELCYMIENHYENILEILDKAGDEK